MASQLPTAGTYVLVTAAYNEEKYIEQTIQSVAAQTVLPRKWIIVSDASTDRTDEIVQKYAERHGFIRLYRITEDHPRNFAAQANAINTGFAQLKGMEYDFIGNLDADISFEPTYFAELLERLTCNPSLGLAGGYIYEEQGAEFTPRRYNNVRSVAHAVQLFRRECLDSLQGYVPLPYGGTDWHAGVLVQFKGWQVRSFPELTVFHHRPGGSAEGRLRAWYRQGLMDFSLGSHPLFEIARVARRVRSRPYGVAAFVRLCGFAWAYCRGEERMVSKEFIEYLRRQEIERLRHFVRGKREMDGAA